MTNKKTEGLIAALLMLLCLRLPLANPMPLNRESAPVAA